MSDGIRISTNNFHYAIWHKRLVATLIDKVLVLVLVMLFTPGSMTFVDLLAGGHWSELLTYLLGFSGMWFWFVPMLYLMVMWGWMSRTVGMMIMKIKIVDGDGKKIGWLKAVFRLFAFILSEVVLFLGFLPVIYDKKCQGLHDRLSKTFVILKR